MRNLPWYERGWNVVQAGFTAPNRVNRVCEPEETNLTSERMIDLSIHCTAPRTHRIGEKWCQRQDKDSG